MSATIRPRPSLADAWRDASTEAMRHLRIIPRNPELLAFATIQPIMFIVLFNYVFGGAIEVPGFTNYQQYLIPGIFAQTLVFNSSFTAVGLAEDLTNGLIDRLRALPIARSAVLVGRVFSDIARTMITFFTMLVVAFLIGFRFEGSLLGAVAGTVLMVGFAISFSWIQAFIGMSVDSVESASAASFIWMFPLTFVSSAFVDPQTMPSWLRPIADHNPFTRLTDAARALYNGIDPGVDLWWSLFWTVVITVVFGFLAIRRFSRVAS
jgi:ABC-2 type transport system permease protein/oleandomycin transport system permease protein